MTSMNRIAALIVTGSLSLGLGGGLGAPDMKTTPTPSTERIVNLGDSITDGQTYALLVSQALTESGRTPPLFLGAGIGGDVSAGMLKRLDRDVLSRRPTSVMLCCGINDLAGGVPMTNYEATITAIAERLKTERVGLMLLTTSNLRGGAQAAALEEIGAILHRVARRYDLPVAEVYDRMEEARKAGKDLWEPDGAHLNFTGYQCMARAVLDAMGARDVPVPAELRCQVLPGIITRWKILTVADNEPPLNDARVAALKVDDRWKDYTLPEEKKVANWWPDQERSRGYAISLNELFGGKRHYAVATLHSKPRQAFVNTGGELGTVWLNGKKLDVHADRGWHAGGNRIAVTLEKGANTLLVETGGRFFISVTDTDTW
jgi:lysophospholipase L1-like esterase